MLKPIKIVFLIISMIYICFAGTSQAKDSPDHGYREPEETDFC